MQRRKPVLLIAILFVGVVLEACSSDGRAPPMAGPRGTGGAHSGGAGNAGGLSSNAGGSTSNDVTTGACTIGDSRACRYVIGTYNNQESCFVGMQYCDTGIWTSCIDPRDAN